MLGRLDAWWYEPAPARRLALLRIFVGGWTYSQVAFRPPFYLKSAAYQDGLFEPMGMYRYLGGPMPTWLLYALFGLFVVSGAGLVLGYRYRVTAPIAAVLLTAILTYRNSWGMIFHHENAMLLHFIVLALAPSAADALSLDARRRGASEPPPDDGRYGWPIKLMITVVALTYLLAGIAKIFGATGSEWWQGEVVRNWVAHDSLRKMVLGSSASTVIRFLYPHTWFFTAVAVGTIIVELGAPVALINQKLRYLVAFAAFSMHWSIWLIMRITFPYHLFGIVYLCFFPVEKIWDRVVAWAWPSNGATATSTKPAG
ncbi:MAG: HTTM domain-containing protein [Deltaproteobacteria bacterium]|nr:HTTM domain-containing protein [Deltaproteobacteria bacterium]